MDANKCFQFIKYCNERTTNSNEYNIARVIISHIGDIQSLSLEEIALQANISSASVSRFITKAGFESFKEFKQHLDVFNRDIKMHRILSHVQRFMRTTVDDLSEYLYIDAINNLSQTKVKQDILKLKKIVKVLKSSHSVIFLGDSHELSNFYTLQLDLLVNGVPTHLINLYDMEKICSTRLEKDDTIVFIGVYEEWFNQEQRKVLEYAKNKKNYIIAFAQEKEYLKEYADILYIYGIPESNNDGYYSLSYLSRVLCEMIYYNF